MYFPNQEINLLQICNQKMGILDFQEFHLSLYDVIS